MGLIAVLAFCAMTSAGDGAPVPPYDCVWVDNKEASFETMTACSIEAARMSRDPIIQQRAIGILSEMTGTDEEKVTWYVWCLPEEDLKDFYRKMYIDDLGDIPENI